MRAAYFAVPIAITVSLFTIFESQQVCAQDAVVTTEFALPSSDDGLPGVGPIRRYPWFQNLWNSRRTAWASQQATQQGTIVFLGDSITQGWGDDFKGQFPDLKLANRGISGDTTRGMLIRLQADVLSLDPSAVVMLMGTNDLEEAATPEMVAENVELILEQLKEHNQQMPIVLCLVFPSSETKKRPAEKIRQVNSLVAEVVKGDPQITVLDTWTLFADSDGNAKEGEFPDLLHPNDLGYQKWAAALKPVFATLGFLETKPEPFEIEPGFRLLFNGHDLTGWCLLPTTSEQLQARERWIGRNPSVADWPVIHERLDLDGKQQSPNGRYQAIGGRLVVTTPPAGRSIEQLWTSTEFGEDFTLKLQFRCTPNADSGVFVRGPQLQCRDFLLAGPYKDLKKYRQQDWNDLVVTVKGGLAHCSCNGEILDAEFKVPETGPIGLEGDRGQLEYRNIRIGPVE
ncbi:MAG: DUF1080 domain-containing protein [Planctomycetales bacterium]|nr:DUF1080 domain-containing protein [Planctomycetales bacterium]